MMSRAKSKDQRTPQISLDSPPLSPSATKRSLPHTCVSPGRADSVRCKRISAEKKQLPRTPEQSPYIRRRRKERIDGMQPKSKSCQRNIEKTISDKLLPRFSPEEKHGENRKPIASKATPRDSGAPIKDTVLDMYSKVRKRFGSLGGGGSGGPIYGEITTKSFQRILQFMKEHCELDSSSSFIDVGSGLGKPNFHVALDVNVKLSVGIELGGERWWQSMILLKDFVPEYNLSNVFFAHGNVFDMNTLNPFSHVYMFDKGFPPSLMQYLSSTFNASNASKYLICYKKPKHIIDLYQFKVKHLGSLSTSMSGSGEGNSVHFYVKQYPRSRSSSKKHHEGKHLEMLGNNDFGFIVPPVPSDISDSAPVAYASSYGQPGLKLLYEQKLKEYTDWCVEQVGITDSSRSSRRLRRRRKK